MVLSSFVQFLLPSIWRSALALGVLPLTTLVLNPEDYGALAIVLSLTGFCSSLGTGGFVYLLSSNFKDLDVDERRCLVSSAMWACLLLILIWAMLFAALLPTLLNWIGGGLITASPEIRWIGTSIVLLSFPLTILATISAVTGEARAFAVVSLLEGTITPLVTLACLFIFKVGAVSLFYGALCGALVGGLSSMLALRHYLIPSVQRRWIDKYIETNFRAIPGTISEQMRTILERTVIAKFVGLASLGIYTHSWTYGSMLRQALKAMANSLWSISLVEAREERSTFLKTQQGWSFAHFTISLFGVFFATLGDDFINLLTNSKFKDAYIFATFSMILILIEASGKPAMARILYDGKQVFHQRIVVASNIISIFWLLTLPQYFGIWGVLISLFVQATVVRGGLALFLLVNRDVPFQDWGVVVGIFFIGFFLAINVFLDISRLQQVTLFVTGVLLLALFFKPAIIVFFTLCKTWRDSYIKSI